VIRTAAEKIFILAQEQMGDQFVTVIPAGMRLEVESVFQNGKRIMGGAARYYGSNSEVTP
jgi:ATP-dependent DNA helicase HFM1/MER3